ncbi:MAG: hypothetical protein IJF23_06465 [Clostridia bacterium]|nr:hypothetical protein [Clostridia bacterium]
MNRTIKLDGNRSITVVSADNSKTAISENDAEMDIRAKEAVRSAINRARTCKKPVAKYDRKTKKAYIETADGVKTYVR